MLNANNCKLLNINRHDKNSIWVLFVCLFDSFQPMSRQVFLGWTSTKQLTCLAQGHNAVKPVRLEPATPQSRVKHSSTEPLHPHSIWELESLVFMSSWNSMLSWVEHKKKKIITSGSRCPNIIAASLSLHCQRIKWEWLIFQHISIWGAKCHKQSRRKSISD